MVHDIYPNGRIRECNTAALVVNIYLHVSGICDVFESLADNFLSTYIDRIPCTMMFAC